jgi:hypothetical protein
MWRNVRTKCLTKPVSKLGKLEKKLQSLHERYRLQSETRSACQSDETRCCCPCRRQIVTVELSVFLSALSKN